MSPAGDATEAVEAVEATEPDGADVDEPAPPPPPLVSVTRLLSGCVLLRLTVWTCCHRAVTTAALLCPHSASALVSLRCFCTPLTLAVLSPTMGFCIRFSMKASSSAASNAELSRLGSTHAPMRDQSSSSLLEDMWCTAESTCV